jgi:hypothetical protein
MHFQDEDVRETESLRETGRLGRPGNRKRPDDQAIPIGTGGNRQPSGLCCNNPFMSTYDNFNDILELLEQCPGLPGAIGMEKAMAFVRLATRLKDEITSKQKPGHDPNQPPDMLPPNVSDFLGHAVQIPDEYVSGCWYAFRRTVWQRNVNVDSVGADAKLFRRYGLQNLLCKWFIFY